MERETSAPIYKVDVARAPLRSGPSDNKYLETELLAGDSLLLLARKGDWAHIRAERDAYEGFVRSSLISSQFLEPTHRVSALHTVALNKPNLHSSSGIELWMNSQLTIVSSKGKFVEAKGFGWIPAHHLALLGEYENDPAAVALRFVGVPYRLGGSTSACLDCSALSQMAFLACGIRIPRNSGQQRVWQNGPVTYDLNPNEIRRGDLVFWSRHVGIMISGTEMVHANADTMDVSAEELSFVCNERRRGVPLAYRRFL
jgi:cell wall-associated NlpC family hydrolase